MAANVDDAEEIRKEGGWWHPTAHEQAPAPESKPPVKLAVEKPKQPFVEVRPFESFALSDEKETVKLYFGLANAKKILPPNSVVATFRRQALEVTAHASPSLTFRFHESILFEHIEPDLCKVKVKSKHILVILHKVHPGAYWEKVSVNRKAVGPVRTSPPDFGKPTVVTTGGTAAPFDAPVDPAATPVD